MEEDGQRRPFRLLSLEQEFDGGELSCINPSLFAREEPYGLQRLFSSAVDQTVHTESVKLEGVLRKLLRTYAAPNRPRPPKPRAKPVSFKKAAMDLLLRHFDAAFPSMFPAAGGKHDQLLALCAGFMDFALATLSSLAARLFDAGETASFEEKLLDSSLTERSVKRGWTPGEEHELAALLAAHYPARVPCEQLRVFGEAHQRTPAAVVNKLHKLRRRCAAQLGEPGGEAVQAGEALERRLRELVEQRGRLVYDDVFAAVSTQRGDEEAAHSVDLALYALLNREQLRCEEHFYVELTAPELCPDSPILQRLLQMLRVGRPIDFAQARDFLIAEFAELDPATPRFDRDLLDYLGACPALTVRQKRVFLPNRVSAGLS